MTPYVRPAPTCRHCNEPIQWCNGRHGDWMHTADTRHGGREACPGGATFAEPRHIEHERAVDNEDRTQRRRVA